MEREGLWYANKNSSLANLSPISPRSWPAASFARPAELSSTTKSEISHLLDYLETSGCQFCRNGTWYNDMKAARDHAEQKYRYFAEKGRINSAEDFIKWAVSKSELSGKPYLVKSGNAPKNRPPSGSPTSSIAIVKLDRPRRPSSPSPGIIDRECPRQVARYVSEDASPLAASLISFSIMVLSASGKSSSPEDLSWRPTLPPCGPAKRSFPRGSLPCR